MIRFFLLQAHVTDLVRSAESTIHLCSTKWCLTSIEWLRRVLLRHTESRGSQAPTFFGA